MKNIKCNEINLNPRKEILSSSHLEISKIYDVGIQACDEKDSLKVCRVIYTLKGLISDQYKEIASGFYRLYDYCIQFANDKNFDKARNILYELHQSWNMMLVTSLNDTDNRKTL